MDFLKWPRRLTLVRHARSQYNALKDLRATDQDFARFRELYAQDWRSSETVALAQELTDRIALDQGDHNTQLAEGATSQAIATGSNLRIARQGELPDIIFVSPYHRTKGTLDAMVFGWPELREVRVVEEERIREQEHGLALLYPDRRAFFALHPLQKRLHDAQGPYWYAYPQGESVPDVRARNRSFLETLVRDFAGQDVLTVTHHITILATRANLERHGEEEYVRLDREEKPINCGVTTYVGMPNMGRSGKGKLILESYNQVLF
jgi:broad specificity phosphatase PhoE